MSDTKNAIPEDLSIPEALQRPDTPATKAAVTRIVNEDKRNRGRRAAVAGPKEGGLRKVRESSLNDRDRAAIADMAKQAEAKKAEADAAKKAEQKEKKLIRDRLRAAAKREAAKAKLTPVDPAEVFAAQAAVVNAEVVSAEITGTSKIEKRAKRMKESFTLDQQNKLEALRLATLAEAAQATAVKPAPAKVKGEPKYIKDVDTTERAKVLVDVVKKNRGIASREALYKAGEAAGYKAGTVQATLYDLRFDGWLVLDKQAKTYGLGPRLAA